MIIRIAIILILLSNISCSKPKPEYAFIPPGYYTLGRANDAVNPQRTLFIESFLIGRFEVTNSQFEAFVNTTGYKTTAEEHKNAMVFEPGLADYEWLRDTTAYWRYPNGVSRGGIDKKMNHPVTCISYYDILAYCKWSDTRLPTIDEWEVASNAGLHQKQFFGSDSTQIHHYANIWKGKDHLKVDENEQYTYTAPVGTYAPNQLGIYDMYGNVFELCRNVPKALERYPNVIASRGGSWWCSFNTCNYFNSFDIGRLDKRASFSNVGFRVIIDR